MAKNSAIATMDKKLNFQGVLTATELSIKLEPNYFLSIKRQFPDYNNKFSLTQTASFRILLTVYGYPTILSCFFVTLKHFV